MIPVVGAFMVAVLFLFGAVVAVSPWLALAAAIYYKRKGSCQELSIQRDNHVGPKMDGKDWLILIGTIFYLCSPLDLLPDVLLGLGWCDDLGLIAFAVKHFYNKFWAKKKPEEREERPVINYEDDAIDAEFEVRSLPARRDLVPVRRHG